MQYLYIITLKTSEEYYLKNLYIDGLIDKII